MKNIGRRFFAANQIWLSFVISICVIVNCMAFMPTGFASGEEKLVLSHVEYVDASGAVVMSLQNTDSIYCKATISNPDSASKDAVLIGALYNTQNGLVKINYADITLNGSQSIEKQIGVTVPSGQTGSYTFKAFVWSSLSNAMPLAASKTFEDKKLMSGNTLGNIFSTSTSVVESELTAAWETEGDYATDGQIAAAGTGFVRDGLADAVSTAGGEYATLLYNFASQKKVEGVTVWAGSGMEKFDVFLSFDGEAYNQAASVNNTNAAEGILPVVAKIENAPVAKFVKIVMKKNTQADKMDIAEAAVFGDEASDIALLTNNSAKGSTAYDGVARIETGSDYKWETKNWEFQGKEYQVITNMADVGDATNNDNLTDGYETSEADNHVCQGGWKDHATTPAYNRYGVVEFDLKAVYQIGRVDVWSIHNDNGVAGDSNRKYMDSYEVFVSEDGASYTKAGEVNNSNDNATGVSSNTRFDAQPGYRGRYVKILMHNGEHSVQLRVGEVAIWGWESEQPEPEFHGAMAAVTPAVSNVTAISADLNWEDYQHAENGVTGYRVYVEKEDFSDVSALTPAYEINDGATKTQKLVNLEDSTQYYAAVTPIGLAGENTQVQTVSFTTVKGIYLLTPNVLMDMDPPSLYNTSVLQKDTGVTATWLATEGDLDMLPISGNAAKPENQDKIFNGNERSYNSNYVYQNGWQATAFGKYTAVVLDFTKAYKIEQIDVWTMDCEDGGSAAQDKLKRRMESYEVLASTDGITYESMGTVTNDADVPNAMCNLPWTVEPPAVARYIKLIFHNDVDSNQLQIGEIAVWGTDAN